MPTNAYDQLYLRNEYKEWYEDAKKSFKSTGEENDRKAALSLLKEMATHEGMLAKKKDVVEDNKDKKDLQELTEAINANFLKRKESMEKLNGTDSK